MDMNLRKDNYFVQDEAWYAAEQRFSDFLAKAMHKKLVLLELGVGFNTPSIIRFPFEKLAKEHTNINRAGKPWNAGGWHRCGYGRKHPGYRPPDVNILISEFETMHRKWYNIY